MIKIILIVISGLLAYTAAKPSLIGAPLAYSAPVAVLPAPFVTATSAQVIARNFNGIAHTPIFAAPLARPAAIPAAFAAPPLVAAAPVPLTARYLAPPAYLSPAYARYFF